MNKVFLVGNNTKDIELKQTKGGKPIAGFTLAVKRNYKNQDGQYESDFINCIAFSKTAELLSSYVKKGDSIGIVGDLQTGNYEKDGKKVYYTNVMVEEVQFLQAKQEKKVEENPKEVNPYELFGSTIEVDENTLPF